VLVHADGHIGGSGSGTMAKSTHEGSVVGVDINPRGGGVEEISEAGIWHGHGDKIILSADAGAPVNKTILFESSLDRQGEDCELEK